MQRKTYHHPDLRSHLIVTTRNLIESEGPDAVTMARVARACDVSVAAPYRHFSDKGALFGAVAEEGFIELRGALTADFREDDAAERLVSAGVAYVAFATAHPHLFRIMFSANLRDRQTAVGPAALAALADHIEPLDLHVPAEVAVRTTWALAHGLATLRIGGMLTFTRDDTERRLRDELTALLTGLTGTSP